MVELLAEGQQLEEELKQIVDYSQGSSLARFRISNTRHTGCDVDVCMFMYVCPVMTHLKKKYFFLRFARFSKMFFFLLLSSCLKFLSLYSYHFPYSSIHLGG